MPEFPSPDWMQAYCDALAAHPQAEEVASAFAGTYRFVIDPDEGGEPATYHIGISAEPTGFRILEEVDGQPALALRATDRHWRELMRRELDVPMAVFTRRLRVEGDVARMLGQLSQARPLVDALGEVPTDD